MADYGGRGGRGGGYHGGGHRGGGDRGGGFRGRGRGDYEGGAGYGGRGGYRGGAGYGGGDRGYHQGGGGRGRGGDWGGDGGRGRGGRGRGGGRGAAAQVSDENPQRSTKRYQGYNFEIPTTIPPTAKQSEQEFMAHFPPLKSLQVQIAEAEEGEEHLVQAISRPGIGRQGKPIQLAANHFRIKFPDNMRVLHYDLALARIVKRPKQKAAAAASATATKPKRAPRRPQDQPAIVVLEDDGEYETVLIKREKWPKAVVLAAYLRLVWNPSVEPNLFQFRYKLTFDGNKNVFSQCNLGIPAEGHGFDIDVKNPDDPNAIDRFRITLKPAAVVLVDMKQVFNRNLIERKSVATTVLDVLLRQSKMFSSYFIPISRRVFYRPENPFPLSGGIERYPGIWESVRPISGWKSTVNLDLANTAFVKHGSIIDLLPDVIRNYNGDPSRVRADGQLARSLEKLVKGLKVDQLQRGELRKRSSKCVGVSKVAASSLEFMIDKVGGGQEKITVARYFEIQHQRGEFQEPIRYPNLPCLQVGSKNKANYIPIEFCAIKEGQRYPRKLDNVQTSEMLNVASQPAPERRRKIEAQVARMNNTNQNPYLRSFNVNIETKMIEFDGRVLAAPTVQYHGGKVISPRDMKDGGWNMKGTRVLKGCTIGHWAVLCANESLSIDQLHGWCDELVGIARNMGVIFSQETPFRTEINYDPGQGALPDLEKFKAEASRQGRKLDLVIVVLPHANQPEIDRYYASIKSAGDVELGVNTQCVLSKNVARCSPSLLANICLKINAKMGGINNTLQAASFGQINHLQQPVLVLGADVNHPAEGDGDSAASVAAVVGCIDKEFGKYAARIMVQDRRKEFIDNLKLAVHQMIDMYFTHNRRLPERIIMYRDGVGESMFLKVLTYELRQIREACVSMLESLRSRNLTNQKTYEPPITFIVVQKRHHTRLFCRNREDEMGRGNNVPPGTVVDTDIVHPTEFDFYLCSHLGLQGTSRPGHYQVLWDDSNFTADDLQLLTYYLCYTYARATKSVSMPPPVYYADLTAFRARAYLSWKTQDRGEGSVVSGSSGGLTAEAMAELQKHVTVTDDIVKKGMFFV